MDKDTVMRAIKEYHEQNLQMQKALDLIDRGLRADVKAEREAKIRQKWNTGEKRDVIQKGMKYFEAARVKASDPMRALLLKTWTSEDNRPGMAAVCSIMETMQPEQQLELAEQINDPVLTTQAISNVRKLTLEPQDRMYLETKVQSLIAAYVDHKTIRENAQAEIACLEFEAELNQKSGGDPVKRMGLGQRAEALKKIIATGELPKSERISVLTHPNPVDRMQQARKAG